MRNALIGLCALTLCLSATEGGAETTVRIVHFYEEGSGPLAALEAVTQMYSKLHEGVSISLEKVPMAAYDTVLPNSLALAMAPSDQTGLDAVDTPDLVQCYANWAKNVGVSRGLVMRVTAYLDLENPFGPGKPWGELFDVSLLDEMRDAVYGDVWALPFATWADA